MTILKQENRYTGPVALGATGLFFIAAAVYFLPLDIPHKITIPVGILTLASLWLCPWQIILALMFSAAGDFMGSCGNLIGQMGFFALGHVFYIIYFIKRYLEKVEHDRKLTAKAKGYMAMVFFCAAALLATAFSRIVPQAPEGIIRTCVGLYACIISAMMVLALLQRSSLYALGAVLFVFSDFILAWNSFVEPIPAGDYLIMVTYYLAQWLLYIRSTPFRVAPEMRLMRF